MRDKEQSCGGRNSGGQGRVVWVKEQRGTRNSRPGKETGGVRKGKERGKEQKSRNVINKNRKYGNMQVWEDTKRGRLEGKL